MLRFYHPKGNWNSITFLHTWSSKFNPISICWIHFHSAKCVLHVYDIFVGHLCIVGDKSNKSHNNDNLSMKMNNVCNLSSCGFDNKSFKFCYHTLIIFYFIEQCLSFLIFSTHILRNTHVLKLDSTFVKIIFPFRTFYIVRITILCSRHQITNTNTTLSIQAKILRPITLKVWRIIEHKFWSIIEHIFSPNVLYHLKFILRLNYPFSLSWQEKGWSNTSLIQLMLHTRGENDTY